MPGYWTIILSSKQLGQSSGKTSGGIKKAGCKTGRKKMTSSVLIQRDVLVLNKLQNMICQVTFKSLQLLLYDFRKILFSISKNLFLTFR
jgi:hypothetical protein